MPNQNIKDLIKQQFNVQELSVTDESAHHAGHAEAIKTGGGHYRIKIVSADFEGKTPVQRHRMIYAALKKTWEGNIHALSIETLTPKEASGT